MEEIDGNPSTILPPPSQIVEKDTKKLIEHKITEEGKHIKVTRIYQHQTVKVSKSIAKRKSWRKFGLAVKDNPHGPDSSTTYVSDDVFLVFTTNKEDLEEADKEDPLKKLKGSSIVKCRVCKGDHWTTKCPYKDSLQPLKDIEDKENKAKEIVDAPVNSTVDLEKGRVGGGGGKSYVPPSLRGGPGTERRGETMNSRRHADEAATLRVTNISEDACESDLQDLFRPFGPVARVYLAKDKVTNQSKGFAFVSYVKREDATRAMKSLQGYGYDHLILNVEWAKPSNN